MKKPYFSLPRARRLALGLGVLALPTGALAQAAPTTIYALGVASQDYAGLKEGQQIIIPLNASNLPASVTPGTAVIITGLNANQQLVGLDYRPATGELYALGLNPAINATGGALNAQLYVLNPTTGVATARGAGISLDLQDTNRANTRGLQPNVGFDFNPTVDRIRVVAPNGTNYRLNPNNGARTVDGALNYVAGNTVGHAPYVGTAAYTNSALGLTGTTLYDVDVTATDYTPTPDKNNSVLATQSPPNDGVLNPIAPLTFAVNGNNTYISLVSPTIGISLDIFYRGASGSTPAANLAYVLEARYSDPNNASADNNVGDKVNRFASNLYQFDLATGRATGRNIFGLIPLYLFDIAIPVAQSPTWIGITSTDWGTGSNWSTGMVPTATDNVVIPGTGTVVQTPAGAVTVNFQPTVSNTQQAFSVNLANGAILTTADGGTLNVSGNFVNNDGTVTGSGSGTVALVGSATQTIGGNAVSAFQNLSVGSAGAATTVGVAIRRSVNTAGTLAVGTGQAFTLLSTATGTAYLVNSGTGAVTGTATVQRYITPTNPGDGYRHYSSPVARNAAVATSNQVNDLATTGFSPVVNPAYNSANTPRQVRPYPTVFYYDQSRLAFSNASYAVGEFDNGFLSPGDLTDELLTGRGYSVNIGSAALVDFQGTLNQAATYSRGGLARGAQTAAGYHLLGNPYPGAVNYDVVIANSAGMESALYVYKSTGQYAGTYSTYVPPGPTNGGPGISNNGGTSNIPVAQGFFVRTAAGQTGTVNFTAGARTNQPETALFQRTAADPRPMLALTLRNADAANQLRVYFDQGATPAFDAKYDAHYLPATHGLDLASDIGTEALAINGLPELTSAVTVPLRLHAAAAGTYTLAVDELNNLPAGYRAYLRDATTGTATDLTTTSSLSLSLAPTDPATGRYTVVFATAAPLATASATLSALAALYPSPAHGTATLVLPQALRGTSASTVQVLNALGQVVLTKTLAAGAAPSLELPLAGLAAGIYTVRATTAAGLVAKRLVVQ